jgi:hypothetical protein
MAFRKVIEDPKILEGEREYKILLDVISRLAMRGYETLAIT